MSGGRQGVPRATNRECKHTPCNQHGFGVLNQPHNKALAALRDAVGAGLGRANVVRDAWRVQVALKKENSRLHKEVEKQVMAPPSLAFPLRLLPKFPCITPILQPHFTHTPPPFITAFPLHSPPFKTAFPLHFAGAVVAQVRAEHVIPPPPPLGCWGGGGGGG